MKSTFTQGFSYPESNDFGNGALDLQLLAEQFDAKMFAIQQGMSAELRPPTIAMSSTNNSITVTSGVNTEITAMFNSIVYNNGFVNPVGNGVVPPSPGSYMYGVLGNANATGTVTANTLRDLSTQMFIPTGASLSSVYVKVVGDTANESGVAGGSFLNIVAVADIPNIPTNPPRKIKVFFEHFNTGSAMQIQSGAILWCTKIANLVN